MKLQILRAEIDMGFRGDDSQLYVCCRTLVGGWDGMDCAL